MSSVGPLEGLTVLEVTERVSGAYCGKLLADMGADVIKVEPPMGDSARLWGPFPDDVPDPEASGLFLHLNTNKRGITVDVQTEEGSHLLRRLVRDVDLLVEDVRLLERCLSVEELHRVNPELTVTSITPFGLRGPYSYYKGNELVLFNWSGFAYTTPGLPDTPMDLDREPPLKPGVHLVGFSAGVAAAVASLLASRARPGQGHHAEVSEHEVMACLNYWQVAQYSYLQRVLPRGPHFTVQMPNCYIPCKDGWVVIIAMVPQHWAKLKEVMGNPEWAEMDIFDDGTLRAANWDALEVLLLEWTMQYTGREICEMLQPRGVASYWALTVKEAAESEQTLAREFLMEGTTPSGRPFQAPKLPFRFGDMPWQLRRPAPSLGQHNQEVLGALPELPKEGLASEMQGDVSAGTGEGETAGRLPLEGVRVVDFGQYIAVPFAAQFLAWTGADVIQVESIHQPFRGRTFVPFADGVPGPNRAALFNALGTSKRCLSLNMSHPRAQELARQLIVKSDVVMDQFSTGLMERWGLGYDELRRIKPEIIMLSLGAFGRTGPMKQFTGLSSVINLSSGLADVTGYEGGHPRILGSYFPDVMSGTDAALAVVAALRHRDLTGQGQYIDQSMVESLMAHLAEPILDLTMNGREPSRMGNHHPRIAPHNTYRCNGNDSWVAITAETEDEWRTLCQVMGRPESISDPRFIDNAARKRNEQELDAVIETWTLAQDKHEVAHRLQQAGVPSAPSVSPKELVEDPHLNVQGFFVPIDHPEVGVRQHVGAPWRISGMASPHYQPAPLMGAYDQLILEELLGLSAEEVRTLIEEGVVQ